MENKEEHLEKIDITDKENDRQALVLFITFMSNLLSFVLLSPQNMSINLTIGIICGAIAFFIQSKYRISTTLSVFSFSIITPFMLNWYFGDKTSFIVLELSIPVIMAIAPSLGLF